MEGIGLCIWMGLVWVLLECTFDGVLLVVEWFDCGLGCVVVV